MCEPNVEEIVSYLSTKFNKIFYDREFVCCVSNDFLKLKNDNNKCCVLVFPALGPVYQRALKYQARAFDLATFGISKTIVVCQKKLLLNENKKTVSEEKEKMSSRETATKRRRPERQLYVPPAQRRNNVNNQTNTSAKSVVEKLDDKTKNDVKNRVENGKKLACLHDLMHLYLIKLPRYSCNVSHKIHENSLSLKNFHEDSCEFHQHLIWKCLSEPENLIPIYHLNDTIFFKYLINDYFCWQPITTDDFVEFDEIIENNCAIPFFNYIKNAADNCDYLSRDLTNTFSLDQMKLNAKIKLFQDERKGVIQVQLICDNDGDVDAIFNERFNGLNNVLRIVCDNEPFDNIVDLTSFGLGHYLRIIKDDDAEYIHVCDLNHDVQKCYMDVNERQRKTVKYRKITKKIPNDYIDVEKIGSNVDVVKEEGEVININNSELKKVSNHEIMDTKKKCEHEEEKEIMRKAKENINRKTRPLMKYSDDSDDLLKIDNKQDNINNWEDLFDDNGQIQEDLLTEIVHKVGKDLTIVKATEDYTPYMQKPTEELEHVVEIYNFPPSLSTGDLIHAFCMFDSNSMYIVWVDDTHALLVLGSSIQAQRAIEVKNPLIKVRPMSNASPAALTVASQYDLKPAMKRPATNLQTARRLITNHLGTKGHVTKEQTARERELLRRAREQRNLTRQNERDAWEGNIRSSLRH